MAPILLLSSLMETCPPFTVSNSEGEQELVTLILAAISIPSLSIRRLGIYLPLLFLICFMTGTQDHFYFLCSHQTKDKRGASR